ncbi:MAG: glycosyltransferase family 39 protein [Candidatus Aureabacteria bacterium]|nr:glycosyltransferase family 39 protein [Candidatus Auribacterota bacterium]NLW94617.1 phospholipid carrier-dependent glycosyltransferase [Chlamydiota bacterium]HOE27568.1 glycosyltransferase family 39 protein [bacterium]HQM52536.1 glycosyltransferase family 39 protein [bacterium]
MKRSAGVTLLWAVPALAVLSFAGQRHGLWGGDEPREAAIAREMHASRDWVVPRLNGEPFLEKPPLAHLGAVIVFDLAGGPDARLCRLPSAAWGFAGLLATAWLGAMLLGPGAGLLAAFILATSVEWLYITRHLLVDVPLAASVVVSFALFQAGYRRRGAPKALGYLGFAFAAGAAFLSKGTVGVALPLSAVSAYLLLRREYREFALLALVSAAGLLVVAAPWVLLLAARGGREALRVFLWDNQVLRFVSPGADHAKAPWFYLPAIFEIFLPWALLLPPAFLGLRRRPGESEGDRRSRQFVLAVLAVPFAILSVASGKRHLYLLPLLPGFAIAVARWAASADAAPPARWEGRWARAALVVFAAAAAAAWCAALGVAVYARHGAVAAAAGAAAGLAASAAVLRRELRKPPDRIPAWSMVALAIIGWAAPLTPAVWEMLEREKGYAPLAAMLEANVRQGETLFMYRPGERELGVVGFHRRAVLPVLETPAELDAALQASGGNVVLVREKVYDSLVGEGTLPASASVQARCLLPHRNQLLLRGR